MAMWFMFVDPSKPQDAAAVFADTEAEALAMEHAGVPAVNVFRECEWYALCDGRTVTFRSHPVLGYVPVCVQHGKAD